MSSVPNLVPGARREEHHKNRIHKYSRDYGCINILLRETSYFSWADILLSTFNTCKAWRHPASMCVTVKLQSVSLERSIWDDKAVYPNLFSINLLHFAMPDGLLINVYIAALEAKPVWNAEGNGDQCIINSFFFHMYNAARFFTSPCSHRCVQP